ncbi:MAG TPA: pseudaminic acid synthase [Candidatus Paceibacterota bacterium]|nr:pseudaminic acid synthase [Candidatus Paceibacterota bacterium]
MNIVTIQQRTIGRGQPCFIVAELSGNHHQNYEEAVELVKLAKEAGADAVKLQTYTPDTITLDSRNKWFIVEGADRPDSWQKKSLYELYQQAYTPWEWQPKLKALADELGILLFSSPFDETAVDFLEQEVEPPCYKVASYEAVHIPLLKKIAATGKPIILSIGFADLEEVTLALQTLRENGATEIAVLHCVTSYAESPRIEDMNLRTIADITERFGVPSGFSDNNGGVEIPVAAAVLGGASIIEKHFILDHGTGSPDARFSIDPEEFKRMVQLIRRAEAGEREEVLKEIGVENAEAAMGNVHYGPANQQEEDNKQFRPGIWAKADIAKGEVFTKENIRVARPNAPDSFMPKDFDWILGRKAQADIAFANPITPEVVQRSRVRRATPQDAEAILEIRNSKEARMQSAENQEEIPLEKHIQWFQKQYFKEGAKNACYVAELENRVAGYCRFDEKEDEVFEVSIAIASGFQGKGLGSLLLLESLEQFPDSKKVVAKVKKDNKASNRLFEKCGFRVAKEDPLFFTYAYSR